LENPIELQPIITFYGKARQYGGCFGGLMWQYFLIRLFVSVETVEKRHAKKPLRGSFLKFSGSTV